jgi:hypothetical protein
MILNCLTELKDHWLGAIFEFSREKILQNGWYLNPRSHPEHGCQIIQKLRYDCYNLIIYASWAGV